QFRSSDLLIVSLPHKKQLQVQSVGKRKTFFQHRRNTPSLLREPHLQRRQVSSQFQYEPNHPFHKLRSSHSLTQHRIRKSRQRLEPSDWCPQLGVRNQQPPKNIRAWL